MSRSIHWTTRVRDALRCSRKDRYPVRVVAGGQPPAFTGESYYWTTPSGKTRINHPSAYRWPKLYHSSTLRIEVGVLWLKANDIAHEYAEERLQGAA